MPPSVNPVKAPSSLLELLDRLHHESSEQEAALGDYFSTSENFDDLMSDKFIALDQDKCHFVYQVCKSIGAINIVEVGTSYGVSTMYLALAVDENTNSTGKNGKVIATENVAAKAQQARKYWHEAGSAVENHIELREGDLRETLASNLPTTIDAMLIDIWAPMALPALKLVEPHLRPGSVIFIDNSISSATRYAELLSYIRSEDSGYSSTTIPYSKGLEMVVKS